MAYYNKQNTGQSLEDKALDRFAEMMIEKIKSIRDDWKKPWFTESSLVWPKNLSGREYNGMNAFMLMLHSEANGYKIPVFMTFDRVVGLNYNKDKAGNKSEAKDNNGEPLPKVTVNKGEKSFPVFITTFTVVNKETKEKISYDDYRKLSNEEQAQYNVYPKQNIYNVFNVDQTNLKESRPELYQELESKNIIQQPEREEGEAFSFPAVDKLIKDNLWICPIKIQHQDNAYYSIIKNEIYVPEKEQFKDGESFYGTTFHEMAHSTGAEAHLNRLKPSTFGSAEYAREELVAELTAALTCQRYGITKNIKDDSAAYLKSWLNNLKESPDFIKSTLIDVKKATAIITQKIDTLQLSIENEMANQVDYLHDNLDDDKFSETKQQTVAYAIEHITGQGNHSGFGWLRDSFNELCNLNTVNDEQITPEQIRYHRSSIAHLISKECSDKLDAEQLNSLEDILDDLSDQYEREEGVGYRR